MPIIEWTKTIKYYSFTPPDTVSETKYDEYKNKIKNYPLCNLNDNSTKSSGNLIYLVLTIGFIGFFLGIFYLFMKKPSDIPGWIYIYFMSSIFFILHPLINMGKLESFRNKKKAEGEKQEYYDDIKLMIMKTKSYSEFISQYKKKYNRVFKSPY